MRVLSPNGTLLRRSGDVWKALHKDPVSPGQDWTHYQFDASNNMVGKDEEQGLPRQFQWAVCRLGRGGIPKVRPIGNSKHTAKIYQTTAPQASLNALNA